MHAVYSHRENRAVYRPSRYSLDPDTTYSNKGDHTRGREYQEKHDKLYFHSMQLEYLESFRACPKCPYPDPRTFDFVLDEENNILGKACTKCNDSFIGVDDTMSVEDVEKILSLSKAPLCPCGNDDIHQYTLQRDAATGEYYFKCSRCSQKVSNHTSESIASEVETQKAEGYEALKIDGADYHIDPCACGNRAANNFQVEFDKAGNLVCIICDVCNSIFKVKDDTTNDPKAPYGPPVGTVRVSKNDISPIKKGDHIKFWRSMRWEHHAIVRGVRAKANELDLIHYYPSKDKSAKGMVMESTLKVSEEDGILAVVQYNDAYSPEDVVERASERLNETNYNFFLHNCEHFARWCKTGQSASTQVSNLIDEVKKIGKNIPTTFVKMLAKYGFAKSGFAELGKAAASAPVIVDTVATTLEQAAAGVSRECASLLCPLGIATTVAGGALVAGIEIYNTVKECKAAKKAYEAGSMDKATYDNVRVGSAATCVFKTVGTVGGGIGGQIGGAAIGGVLAATLGGTVGSIVCPIAGGFIGATLGYLLGLGIGKAIKWGHAKWQQGRNK